MRLHHLLESPDCFRIHDMILTAPSNGTAFCFITPTVLATASTHPFIFNAMRKYSGGAKKSIFKDYGVRFLGGPVPPPAQVQELSGVMGENRIATLSGRVWKDVVSKQVGRFSGVSFWFDSNTLDRNPHVVSTVVDLFGLSGLIYVEAIDYQAPEVYQHVPQLLELASQVDPSLDRQQIIDLLIRAHTSPDSLSPRELEVVWELRGKAHQVLSSHGYETDAEWRFRSRFSESVAKLRRS